MLLGILSDTHDQLERTQRAVRLLQEQGAEALIHCGDLTTAPIVEACSVLPFWFVFGNNDADEVPALKRAAEKCGATCLEWGGVITLADRRIGIVHGHRRGDLRRVLAERPDVVLSGHSHAASDTVVDSVRRINPGALHRAAEYTVALLDLESMELRSWEVESRRKSPVPSRRSRQTGTLPDADSAVARPQRACPAGE